METLLVEGASRRPSPRPCYRLPRPRVQMRGRFFVEMVRDPWRHRPLLRPWSRVGNFLCRLHVQLEVKGQVVIRYIELEVLCGGASMHDSGVTQWGVYQYPLLWGDDEWLFVGE